MNETQNTATNEAVLRATADVLSGVDSMMNTIDVTPVDDDDREFKLVCDCDTESKMLRFLMFICGKRIFPDCFRDFDIGDDIMERHRGDYWSMSLTSIDFAYPQENTTFSCYVKVIPKECRGV